MALGATSPAGRAKYARAGLASEPAELAPDTQVLLLRQLYQAHLEQGQLEKAVEVAGQMAAVGPLADLAHHDASRALQASGDLPGAITAQRLAVRRSPAARRSFHLWSLATLQHFADDVDGALRSLARAERWAHRDRPLIRAHAAYVRLSSGIASPELDKTVTELLESPAREGYGQYLLGMLAWHMGDVRRAAVYLRAWLRRHAAADRAKVLTLQEELRRARRVLADVESD